MGANKTKRPLEEELLIRQKVTIEKLRDAVTCQKITRERLKDCVDSIESIIKQMETFEWALRGIVAPCNNEGDVKLFDPVKIANIALRQVDKIRLNERERIYGEDARRFVYDTRRIIESLNDHKTHQPKRHNRHP